ncbi:MAG: glycine cleavage system aminomethyltransferase GcvT [Acidimicrobiia bacterium]
MTRQSPLHAAHERAGARMMEFGGWEMPLQYLGVVEEHEACRHDAVVFDVSHLGSVAVDGPGAFGALQWALTNDLSRIAPGRAQYSHLLDATDAHVVDDVIVWWVGPESFVVMPNASNTAPIVSVLTAAANERGGAQVTDITVDRAVLAIQGPNARARLSKVSPEAAAVKRFDVTTVPWRDTSLVVAGTGYTGEDGVEIQVPVAHADAFWRALLDAGVRPAGLGARDTLRLEMGYPLHGHELGPGITPLEAGLGWVVRTDKGPFRGREALTTRADAGVDRLLFGLRGEGRQIPRAGCAVYLDDAPIGEVSSGSFSPTLGCGIALAFLSPTVAEGHSVEIDIRGRRVPAMIVPLPILAR